MEEAQPTTPAVDPLEGWITEAQGGVTVLRLEEPVAIGTAAVVTELRFERIRARHLRAMTSEDTDGLLKLVEVVTRESRRVVDDLSVADAMRAIALVARGFPDGPARGAGS